MCAALMACSLAACAGTTASNDATQTAVVSENSLSDAESTLSNAITKELTSSIASSSADADSKEETVFVFTDASGKQSHVIVNEKLNNATGQKSIKDVSTLSNITNLTGDEQAAASGSQISWEADGSSITYQGTTTKTAPVTMSVTYYLDGKEIKAEDLAGKSGKVTMRFDYTNNEKSTVKINGENKDIYVPFTMVTGMILPSDKFSNIQVTNGKITENDDTNVVLGITMPGLKESLDLSFDGEKLDLDIPEYFEVTADVTDFELDMTMSVATSNFLSDVNVDDLTIDDLKSQMNELQDGANQLVDGTGQLAAATPDLVDGTAQLADGAGQLSDGTGQLKEKVPTLTDGVTQLDNGAGQLSDGTGQFVEQMPTLTSGISALYTGAGQLFDGVTELKTGVTKLKAGTAALADPEKGLPALQDGLKKYTAGVASAADGAVSLNKGIATLSTALDDNIKEYEAHEAELQKNATLLETIGSSINETLKSLGGDSDLTIQPNTELYANGVVTSDTYSKLANKYLAGYKYATENADSPVVTTINASLSAYGMELADIYKNEMIILVNTAANESAGQVEQTVKDSVVKLSDGATKLQAGLDELKAYSESLNDSMTSAVSGVKQLDDGVAQLAGESGVSALLSGAESLKNGIGTLSESSKTIVTGMNALDDGAKQLKVGTAQLLEGAGALALGVTQLDDGAKQLKTGADQLSDGAVQLNDGVVTLNDGMIKFNEEGINKITSLVGTDADTALETVKKVIELGQSYQSFAGKADDVDGTVTFIYKTEGINVQ